MPVIVTPASSGTTSALMVAKLEVEGRIGASISSGTPNSVVIAGDQSRVSRSISIVRDALDGSVAKTPPSLPPLSHHSSQLSTVHSAGATAPSSTPWSSSQVILVAEK